MFADFWQSQGLSSEQIPFDGRSDYVGFTNLGIPAGGIFAGAEAPKTPEQEAIYGGAAGEQLDPCYHDYCDRLSTILGMPPQDVLSDPLSASKMAGGGARSMRQFLPAMTRRDLAFRQGQEPAARAPGVRSGDAPAAGTDDAAKRAVPVPGPPVG